MTFQIRVEHTQKSRMCPHILDDEELINSKRINKIQLMICAQSRVLFHLLNAFSRRPLTPLAVWVYGRYCPIFDAPLGFLAVLRQLHDGQMGQVKGNGSLSDSFLISNGAR